VNRPLPPMFFCAVVALAMVAAFLLGAATGHYSEPVLCDEDAQATAQTAYYANTVMVCSGVTVVLQD